MVAGQKEIIVMSNRKTFTFVKRDNIENVLKYTYLTHIYTYMTNRERLKAIYV